LQLNTPAGVINLETFETRRAQATDYITKITAVAPSGDCPRWLQFIDEVTGGDKELGAYLARVAGYSLTGSTQEHALFFFYGTGRNGKSVFLNTLSGILGDYQRVAPIETFTLSTGERHPTELAMLRGARLVTATETEEGRRWAESRIKVLTGGDPVSARFMRQDFFDFVPAFKLLIAGNHKPGLRSVDVAIRRRFNLIPFTVTIPEDKCDPELSEKLKAEWPGILQWMLDGCQDWRERGLAPPEAVTKATDAYLQDEDAVAAWIGERCEKGGEDTLSALYANWKGWAADNGEPERSNKWLAQALEARGYEPRKSAIGKRISGLRVKPTYSAQGER
jgi:putative DNA primase/helicase